MKIQSMWLGLGLVLSSFANAAPMVSEMKTGTVAEGHLMFYTLYPSVNQTQYAAPVKFKLLVNEEIDPIAPNFDNEIESHGHYDYLLSGKIEEPGFSSGQKTKGNCSFQVLWFQETGSIRSTQNLIEKGIDSNPHWNRIRLCSGLVMHFESVRKLLIEGSEQNVEIYSPGISIPLAKGTMMTKKAPEPVKTKKSDDPCHDQN